MATASFYADISILDWFRLITFYQYAMVIEPGHFAAACHMSGAFILAIISFHCHLRHWRLITPHLFPIAIWYRCLIFIITLIDATIDLACRRRWCHNNTSCRHAMALSAAFHAASHAACVITLRRLALMPLRHFTFHYALRFTPFTILPLVLILPPPH